MEFDINIPFQTFSSILSALARLECTLSGQEKPLPLASKVLVRHAGEMPFSITCRKCFSIMLKLNIAACKMVDEGSRKRLVKHFGLLLVDDAAQGVPLSYVPF